ncbi:ROK family protein [Peteryoungia desertarenae]|uniref:ROK family protein n=1 Tax=Peteryoungia desertarenae TaxID=1813451 RepID=A0ABX6QPX8_9HYPH|nr:ROK family protein [Peteryoungia desertarenae]QLF70312.1 ROK family protein [Peteryoungia desertarenae]
MLNHEINSTNRLKNKIGPVIGIDLGGTKILAGIADPDGRLLAQRSEPTAHGAGAPVLQQMARLCGELAADVGASLSEVVRMAIGIPSAVDPKTGLASLSPNLALPEDKPLSRLMQGFVPCPVLVENDVNLAAFGEAHAGIGKGKDSLVFLSFGTGIGMGTVIGGRLLRGAHGRAGEIAYLPIGDAPHLRAPSSPNGLLEDAVGTPGIRARYLSSGGSVADLFDQATRGDALALAALDEVARNSAIGLAAIHALIDPSVTVIGGGFGSRPEFFERLQREIALLLPFPCRLEPSRFGHEAGLAGAIMFALNHQAH